MKGTPTRDRYDPTVCIDCYPREDTGRRVMLRQVSETTVLPLCPQHADERRATGDQTVGSKPPRRLRR